MNGLSMFLRVRRLDAIASFILSKAHFFQQETLSSSRHRRHTRRRWGRPIPPEPDTKKVLHNPHFSWLWVLSGSVVTSSATFHRKYQVPVQLCWEEQSCCPGCLLLPTFMFWQEHWYLPKGFFNISCQLVYLPLDTFSYVECCLYLREIGQLVL